MAHAQPIIDTDPPSDEIDQPTGSSDRKKMIGIKSILTVGSFLFVCFFAQTYGQTTDGFIRDDEDRQSFSLKYPVWLGRPSSSKNHAKQDRKSRRVRAQQNANHSWEDEVLMTRKAPLHQKQPTMSWTFQENKRSPRVDDNYYNLINSVQNDNTIRKSNAENILQTALSSTNSFEDAITILGEGASRLRRSKTIQNQPEKPTPTWKLVHNSPTEIRSS